MAIPNSAPLLVHLEEQYISYCGGVDESFSTQPFWFTVPRGPEQSQIAWRRFLEHSGYLFIRVIHQHPDLVRSKLDPNFDKDYFDCLLRLSKRHGVRIANTMLSNPKECDRLVYAMRNLQLPTSLFQWFFYNVGRDMAPMPASNDVR